MPVIEYKMHVVTNKGGMAAPLWVEDGGYWPSPIDNTKVGWAKPDSSREYYMPDTVTELTKSTLLTRQLAIHAVEPFTKDDIREGEDNVELMDSAEVTTMTNSWYDSFVASKS
tara:strand:+ start:59 stop:397 length:339 start_codon:yes stop_codon:yes gene_type:complete